MKWAIVNNAICWDDTTLFYSNHNPCCNNSAVLSFRNREVRRAGHKVGRLCLHHIGKSCQLHIAKPKKTLSKFQSNYYAKYGTMRAKLVQYKRCTFEIMSNTYDSYIIVVKEYAMCPYKYLRDDE